VAFDGNFRASGWPCVPAARAAIEGVLQHVDIALPTLADEAQVFGDENAEACVRRLRDAGVGEIAVKLGADGSLIADRSQAQHVPAVPGVAVLDTTAAGDAFNGAYLAMRLTGASPREAAEAGNALAAEVITHPGALIPPGASALREND
jgi:2-dehydro-3-deoxygluconokinase